MGALSSAFAALVRSTTKAIRSYWDVRKKKTGTAHTPPCRAEVVVEKLNRCCAVVNTSAHIVSPDPLSGTQENPLMVDLDVEAFHKKRTRVRSNRRSDLVSAPTVSPDIATSQHETLHFPRNSPGTDLSRAFVRPRRSPRPDKSPLGIPEDVRMSGLIPLSALPADRVAAVRGSTVPNYSTHAALRVSEEAPWGSCRQWGALPSECGRPPEPFKAYYDLTDHLEYRGVSGLHLTAQAFMENEFTAALELISPIIRDITGEDYFYGTDGSSPLVDQVTPQSWNSGKQPYPPRHTKRRKSMAAFGVKYFCDHRWTSGCLETAVIKREYAFDKTRAIYSLELSTGRHRIACNHATAKTTFTSAPGDVVAALHPAADMYLRKRLRANPKVVSRDLLLELAQYLRRTTSLHCSYPVDDSVVLQGSHRGRNRCAHLQTLRLVSENEHFEGCNYMPATIRRSLSGKGLGLPAGVLRQTCNVTPDVGVALYPMMVLNGQSLSGSYTLEPEAEKQAQLAVTKYRKEFGGDKRKRDECDNGMPATHTLRDVHDTFLGKNLFQAWREFAFPSEGAKR